MAEPTSATTLSLVGLGVALFGAAAGPYAAIIFAALAGGLYSTSRYETSSKASAAWTLLRIVVVAVVLSGAAVWGIETTFGWSSPHLVALVAFTIALFYDKWPEWAARVIEGFVNRKSSGG